MNEYSVNIGLQNRFPGVLPTHELVELHVQISSDAAINSRALTLALTLKPTRLHDVITVRQNMNDRRLSDAFQMGCERFNVTACSAREYIGTLRS